jgi:lysozyme
MEIIKTISDNGVKLIKHSEALHDGDLTKIGLQPKRCPAGIWTVGWGHALFYPNGGGIKSYEDAKLYYPQYMDMIVEQADQLFTEDMVIWSSRIVLIDRKRNILQLTPKYFNQSEFDSLVSFAYNEGIEALRTSTLLKRINDGATNDLITDAFLMWNKGDTNGDGKLEVLPGLTFRRKTEALLFTEGRLQFFN